MIARTFAVLAAVFLVAAVALAALLSPEMPLGEALQMTGSDIVGRWRELSSVWSWQWLSVPVLSRPVWLLPAAIGLVCAGFAASFNLGRTSQSHRKRS